MDVARMLVTYFNRLSRFNAGIRWYRRYQYDDDYNPSRS